MAASRFAQPLNAGTVREVMTAIMAGRLPEPELREFLTTLARRGETAEEIATAAAVLREHAVKLPLKHPEGLCDTCGTGGDGQGTVNVSTLAALIAAGAGVRIAKHGNRAASSRCGSADVLEALGVNLQANPLQVARCIDELGFGFCFAPAFHPAMKVVAPVRKALGLRTIFNLIGPLANPAPLTYQLVGVADAKLLRPIAEALVRLGVRRAMVVHGSDGMDEVTLTGPTQVIEVAAGRLTPQTLEPGAFGLRHEPVEALRSGEDVAAAAGLARRVLEGEASPALELVLLNAGCVVYLAEQAPTIEEGIAQARQAVAAGEPLRILEAVKAITKNPHAG